MANCRKIDMISTSVFECEFPTILPNGLRHDRHLFPKLLIVENPSDSNLIFVIAVLPTTDPSLILMNANIIECRIPVFPLCYSYVCDT